MIEVLGQFILLGLAVAAGFYCVRMLEQRDLRRVADREKEQVRRHPQMRLF